MTITYVMPKTQPLKAILVTEENLEEAARFCNGDVKGTKLPKADRVIRWYDQGWEIGDLEARVGDWIVKWGQGYSPYEQKRFEETFRIVHETRTFT